MKANPTYQRGSDPKGKNLAQTFLFSTRPKNKNFENKNRASSVIKTNF